MSQKGIVASVLLAFVLCIPLIQRVQATDLVLAIDGDQFTINGTPNFLVFVSYMDALDVSSGNLSSDFAFLKSKGVDGVRIFPNWWGRDQDWPAGSYHFAQDTVIDSDGTLDSGPMDKLMEVLDIAKEEGLVVDVSFSAESVMHCSSEPCTPGNPPVGDLDFEDFKSGIVAVATALAAEGSAYKHILYDIQNECDHVGPSDTGALTASEVDEIAEAIRLVDPYRPLTASVTHYDAEGAAEFATEAEIDVVAWHEDRDNPNGGRTPTRGFQRSEARTIFRCIHRNRSGFVRTEHQATTALGSLWWA